MKMLLHSTFYDLNNLQKIFKIIYQLVFQRGREEQKLLKDKLHYKDGGCREHPKKTAGGAVGKKADYKEVGLHQNPAII